MNLTEPQKQEVLWHEFGGVPPHDLSIERPFYWMRIPADTAQAPSGWYQRTDSGLVYLGESILEAE